MRMPGSGRWALVLLAGVLLLPVGSRAEARDPAKPVNIVLMLADDLGYGDVSCYGADKVRTPNIDRLAAEGVRFTDAHAPAAVCQPTRYGIMAGRYPWRATRKEPGLHFQDHEILLPRVLKENGYHTAAFGKWHLGWGDGRELDAEFWNGEISPGPLDTGFDYYFGVPQSHSQPPFVFVENTRIYKGDPADPLTLVKPRRQDWKWTADFGGSDGAKAAHEAADYDRLDLILAERAGDFIARQSAKKPFFVYLPFYAPHVPLLPAKEFRGTSKAGDLGDYIQQLDAAVGMVLGSLEQHGFADNTLVIFTSDNGGCYILGASHGVQGSIELGHRSNGPFLGLKTDAWEGGHRVPFVARWPGRIPSGKTCDHLLSLTDLFATFAAAGRIPLPRDAAPDSLDQLPLLLHPEGTPAIRTEMVYSGRGTALRSGDWVYLPQPGSMGLFGTSFYMPAFGYTNSDFTAAGELRPDAPPAQLYNLRDDPAQTTNLYHVKPEIVASLAERLREITRQNKSR